VTGSDVSRLTDDLFRHEAGKVVSMLVKSMGVEHLQLAEDVVQEALTRALKSWPFYGVPENPAGWITQTAKNLALDAVRRDQVFRRKQIDMFGSVHRWSAQVGEADFETFGREVEDAVLRLMFVCCHPAVPENSQAVLALKTVGGFGVGEIARGLFLTEAAVNKRLIRAKEKLVAGEVSADLPIGESLEERLDGVLRTLYLLFNEGYKASTGEALVREDLCAEAIRLGSLVTGLAVGDRPRAHALLALMLLNAARLAGRVDSAGNILLLRDQDRSVWDREMIARGLWHLGRSASGDELDTLHLQAAIAAVHCVAADFESTDWEQILVLYDHMAVVDRSPVVALNRAVAVGRVSGAACGLAALDEVSESSVLSSYYLYFAVRAEFERELGRGAKADELIRQAIGLAGSGAERAFLESRLGRG
jgi:RNA polymerase sigma-70 factor (ECF subfamily)